MKKAAHVRDGNRWCNGEIVNVESVVTGETLAQLCLACDAQILAISDAVTGR